MQEFTLLLPEIFLATTLVGVVLGEIGYHGERIRLISATAIVGLTGAFLQTLLTYQYGVTQVFGNSIVVDGLSLFFKLLFILLGLFTIISSLRSKEIDAGKHAEYCAFIVASVLAMCLVSAAANLLLAFVAVQLLMVLLYVLAGFNKREVSSIGVAIKSLMLGSVASLVFLLGIVLLFAATHSINIYEIRQAVILAPLKYELGLVIFSLISLMFMYGAGAFPMNLWVPDVIGGAPTPTAAFIFMAARVTYFAMAVRIFLIVFTQPSLSQGQWAVLGEFDWREVIAVFSGFSMVIGALLAIGQDHGKRMVACIGVSQAGFLLMGLLVLDQRGVAALLYNLIVDLFAVMIAFHALSLLIDELGSDCFSGFRGVIGRRIPESVSLILAVACLSGIPPLPGFFGKFALIEISVKHGWHALALLGIISIAISTVAVARLSISLVGSNGESSALGVGYGGDEAHISFLACAVIPMLVLGIFCQWFLNWVSQSLGLILW